MTSHPERVPQKKLLVGRARKAWLSAHIAFSVAWLGTACCMLTLGATAIFADPHLQIAAYELMHVFDRAVNIPIGTGMLVTGLVVSLRTKWGLLRHTWVLVKFILSILTLVLAPVLSVPRILAAIDHLENGRDLGTLPFEIIGVSTAIIASLVFMTVVSVFKPWGRTSRVTGRGRAVRAQA